MDLFLTRGYEFDELRARHRFFLVRSENDVEQQRCANRFSLQTFRHSATASFAKTSASVYEETVFFVFFVFKGSRFWNGRLKMMNRAAEGFVCTKISSESGVRFRIIRRRLTRSERPESKLTRTIVHQIFDLKTTKFCVSLTQNIPFSSSTVFPFTWLKPLWIFPLFTNENSTERTVFSNTRWYTEIGVRSTEVYSRTVTNNGNTASGAVWWQLLWRK